MNYNHLKVPRSRDAADWNIESGRDVLKYAVGALLYTPGNHKTIGRDICTVRYPMLKSIGLCLEDSVMDCNMADAEHALVHTLKEIAGAVSQGALSLNDIPMIFIRVRTGAQILDIMDRLGESGAVVTGFLLPKFCTRNQEAYIKAVLKINQGLERPKLIMPILESGSIMSLKVRDGELCKIKAAVDAVAPYILNIRVGGNDFCNIYGLRRGITQTIYDIALVRDALTDILNLFAADYVVSGPVWEYFGRQQTGPWLEGLKKEAALDRLNGFTGKTAIHLAQLEPIQESYMVTPADYDDALQVLNWDSDITGVKKGGRSMRMNEMKVHRNWAEKTLRLAEIYGVRERDV